MRPVLKRKKLWLNQEIGQVEMHENIFLLKVTSIKREKT